MAFDAAGALYVIDTRNDLLLNVNKTTAQILSSVPLSRNLDDEAGMDFHPLTGALYVVDGSDFPQAPARPYRLYTLNPTTGSLTIVGPTGLTLGLSGLAFTPVPEPSSLAAISIAVAPLLLAPRPQRRSGFPA
jgi:DNA-binding beta-propeller fold protein YncE